MGVLLGGSETLRIRDCSAIVGKAPTWIGGGLFLPGCKVFYRTMRPCDKEINGFKFSKIK